MLRSILLPLLSLSLGAQPAPPAPPPAQAPAQVQSTAPAQAAPPAAATAPEKPAVQTLKPQPRPHPMPMPSAPKEEAIPVDQVIGGIGGKLIYERDFHAWLKAMAGQKRFEQLVKNAPTLSRIRTQFLDSKVLAAKARKDGIQNLPAYKEKIKAQEEQALVQIMMSGDEDGTAGKNLNQKIENPSDEEMKAYFEKNSQRFDTPEKFTARHLLVGIKGSPRMGDKGLTDEEAKAKIAKIQAELAAGKKLEDLVKENSDDLATKNSGGLIKDATFGVGFAKEKEFEEAIRKQEIGKVGEPVKTVNGYHLILVEARSPKQVAVFEQVKDRVKQQMLPERRESMNKAFMEEAKKETGFVAGAEAAKTAPKKTVQVPKAKKK